MAAPSGSGPMSSALDRAVRLAEGVTADDQRQRLLVVHRHAAERLADVTAGRHRIRVAVGALGVDVDQAHLHGAERARQFAVAAVALVAEPLVLRAPEDLLRLPDVLASAAEPERGEAHRLQRAVAGVDQQVGPRQLAAVLLLDRPEQPAGLVEADVVGPAVERGEALGAAAATAAAVGDAVRAGGMPRHADEQRAVVAVVGRPPVLRGRHDLLDVLLERGEIDPWRTRRRSRSPRPSGWPPASAGGGRTGRAGSATSPGSTAGGTP